MAPADGLRIGDADREAIAASLREHFAQGRLTLEELQHRLGAALSAKTDRDLGPITRDLPAYSPGAPPGASGAAGQRRGRQSWPRAVAGMIVLILMLAVVAALLPVALLGSALSRSVLWVLSILLLGRRGLLGKLRRWLIRSRRRLL